MTEFVSDKVTLNTSAENACEFLGDFTNFSHLMPDRVSKWVATPDTCSFKVENLADLTMRIAERNPGKNIHIVSDGNNPVDYTLDIFFYSVNESSTQAQIVFNAKLNPFLKAMASKPLKNFVDMLASKLQEYFAK